MASFNPILVARLGWHIKGTSFNNKFDIIPTLLFIALHISYPDRFFKDSIVPSNILFQREIDDGDTL